jgi:soluble lytic murein transglycosylase-like protein
LVTSLRHTSHAATGSTPITVPALVAASYRAPVPKSTSSGPPPAQAGTSALPPDISDSAYRRQLLPLFQHWASVFSLPVTLVEGLCWVESRWDGSAVSTSDAVGIGQLEPSAVKEVSAGATGHSDPAVSSDNIEMTAAYLRYLLNATGGNEEQALADYNEGPTAVAHNGIYPATQQYVNAVRFYSFLFKRDESTATKS